VFSPLTQQLIDALRCLPGVGPKSAQRMALQLLERDRQKALTLAETLTQAATQVKRCEQCRTFTEMPLCTLCQDSKRNLEQLCVVESPGDIIALEQTSGYKGYYFVLMGHLSPIDGIGPEHLGLDQLANRIKDNQVTELIIATNPTVEGEATAYYIANLVNHTQLVISRIAHGVPMGGELEYLDGNTLARAFSARVRIEALSDET